VTARAVGLACIALVAALAAAAPARGQDPSLNRDVSPPNAGPNDTVYYRDPTTGQLTAIMEGERRKRVEDLRALLAGLDESRQVIVTLREEPMIVPVDRIPKMTAWLVANGKATPAEAAAWVEEQRTRSRRFIEGMRKELQALQGVGQALASPPGEDFFPTPMDWLEVRGSVRGRYRVRCYYEGKILPDLQGPFTIELVGDGTVRGTFEDDQYQYQANGEVSSTSREQASLSGSGQGGLGSTVRWDARVQREGNKIMLLANGHVFMTPNLESGGAKCDPGYLEQTE
jgi:hypothetical protein